MVTQGAQGAPREGCDGGVPPEADAGAQALDTSFIAGTNRAPAGREIPEPCQASLRVGVGAGQVHGQPVAAGHTHVLLRLPRAVGAGRPRVPAAHAARRQAHGARRAVEPRGGVGRLGAGGHQVLRRGVHEGVGGLAGPARGRHLPPCQHGLAVEMRRRYGCAGVVHVLPQELLITGLAQRPCQRCQHQGHAQHPARHGHLEKVGLGPSGPLGTQLEIPLSVLGCSTNSPSQIPGSYTNPLPMSRGSSLDSWAICQSCLHRSPKVMHSPEASVPHGTSPTCSSDPWLPYRSTVCSDTRIPYTALLPHWMPGLLTARPHPQTFWSPVRPSPASVWVPPFPLWPQGLQDPSHSSARLLYWPKLCPMGKDPGGGAG